MSSRSTPPPDASFWTYSYNPHPKSRTCCGRVNRGPRDFGRHAIHGNHRRPSAGARRQDRPGPLEYQVADPTEFYSITHAPLVVKDKVIVGTAGGDIGIGGILAAYRRAHRQGGVALPHHSTTGRTGSRNLGGRFLETRRSGDLEYRIVRSGDQSHLLGHRKPATGLGWPQTRRRQSLQRFGDRTGRRHRQAEMVLPVHAARRNGLRFDAGSRAGRHRVAGRAAQSNACGPIATA